MMHYQITIPEKAAVTINGFIAGQRSPIKNLYLAGQIQITGAWESQGGVLGARTAKGHERG